MSAEISLQPSTIHEHIWSIRNHFQKNPTVKYNTRTINLQSGALITFHAMRANFGYESAVSLQ